MLHDKKKRHYYIRTTKKNPLTHFAEKCGVGSPPDPPHPDPKMWERSARNKAVNMLEFRTLLCWLGETCELSKVSGCFVRSALTTTSQHSPFPRRTFCFIILSNAHVHLTDDLTSLLLLLMSKRLHTRVLPDMLVQHRKSRATGAKRSRMRPSLTAASSAWKMFEKAEETLSIDTDNAHERTYKSSHRFRENIKCTSLSSSSKVFCK